MPPSAIETNATCFPLSSRLTPPKDIETENRLSGSIPKSEEVPVSVVDQSSGRQEHDIGRLPERKIVNGTSRHPAFEDLPYGSKTDPKASAWGLWGPTDELGTSNYLTPEIISHASKEIQTGVVVPLNLPLDCPIVPMNPRRAPCEHEILAKGYANDDKIELNTQSSSHWDGLRHYPYQDEVNPRYYNGASQADISGPAANNRIGIHNAAQHGIVGRGVLLDWRTYAIQNNIKYSPFESHPIPLSELLTVAEEQKVIFEHGDILLIRSGWTEEYLKLSPEEQRQLSSREKREFVGVDASREMIKWHWDNGFSAVAGDTNAYEVWPPTKPWGVACHEVFLSGWGMPIGEVWDLEALAVKCKEVSRWTFFLTSMPLNLKGGVASPANVMAIF
ncbi:uncharacterized protein LY89DRAFT_768518 [Mollisia scopiformis]|uniref:Cyclase n=1 Tax=Mollisia scopiformis TaxID=149040 RepID=A0A194XR31_MOLSC|nr:uncharacterized protein LY89DRAFT_768518 [Mollisia scopiformis]KUJ22187.1 hypothetical protein LY89DRAFT_768518 [Mollisia scopiformis]